jgi:hypothetical protein
MIYTHFSSNMCASWETEFAPFPTLASERLLYRLLAFVCIAYTTAAVKNVQSWKSSWWSATPGPGPAPAQALNDILGTKFRIVGAYPSSADVC